MVLPDKQGKVSGGMDSGHCAVHSCPHVLAKMVAPPQEPRDGGFF